MLHSLLRSAGGDYNNRKCSRAETFCCNSAHHARNASAEQEKMLPKLNMWDFTKWSCKQTSHFFHRDGLPCLLRTHSGSSGREKCTKLYLITLGGIFRQNQYFGILCMNTGWKKFSLLFTEFVAVLQYGSQSFFTRCSL